MIVTLTHLQPCSALPVSSLVCSQCGAMIEYGQACYLSVFSAEPAPSPSFPIPHPFTIVAAICRRCDHRTQEQILRAVTEQLSILCASPSSP